VKISLDYLDKEFIDKITNLIKSHVDEVVKVNSEDIIKVPLLKYDTHHEKEIEILELFRKAYYDLNFKNIYELLADNCRKVSCSEKDNYKAILGKENIIKDLENLVNTAKKNNLIYQGSCSGELTDEYESIVSLSMTGRAKDKILKDDSPKRNFILHIDLDNNDKIERIEIRDFNMYPEKFLSKEALEKISKGEYSDFKD